MADLSNRALALLLVVAVVVSVTGTTMTVSKMQGVGSPVGFLLSNGTGIVNFSITSNFSIRFNSPATLLFGTGTIIGGDSCMLGTNGSPPSQDANCLGFNETLNESNLTVENDGNIRANVSLNFSLNATGLISGTAPSLQYRVDDAVEASSCATIYNGTNFQEVDNGGADGGNEQSIGGVKVCENLNFADGTDQFEIGIWMLLPENAPTGERELTIYAIGCDDDSC